MNGQIVYADLTFLTNLSADFLLLFFTGLLTGSRISLGRLLAAASAGAGFALLFVLDPGSLWVSPLPRLGFALVMILIAFYPLNRAAFIRAVGFFYLLSFLAGGGALALAGLGWSPMSWRALPGALMTACLASILGYRWLTQKSLTTRHFCHLELVLGEGRQQGTGLVDTGNSLCDPVSGRPVLIAEYEWVKALLPEELCEMARDRSWNTARGAELMMESNLTTRIRLLPYSSIGQAGDLMLAVVFDQVLIKGERGEKVHNQVLVALAPTALDRGNSFQALIPAALA